MSKKRNLIDAEYLMEKYFFFIIITCLLGLELEGGQLRVQTLFDMLFVLLIYDIAYHMKQLITSLVNKRRILKLIFDGRS